MKKVFNIIVCATFALLSAACSQVEEIEMGAEEGVVSLNVAFASTRADIDPNTPFELKIYRYANAEKSERELVRKYTALADVPEYIWLVKDNYVAQVKVGEKELASFETKYYTGAADFEITPGNISTVSVDCMLFNTPVKVIYDSTVAAHFTKEFYTYVCAADSFNLTDAKQGNVPTLKYTEEKVGYFILPDGCSNLSWYFCGSDGSEQITNQGVIENIEANKYYSLSFKYSKDAPGSLIVEAVIDYSVDHREDKVPFSPDPTVKSVGFDIDSPIYYTGGGYEYNIAALDTIKTLAITVGDQTIDLLNGTTAGVAVTSSSAKNYNVVLSEEFFALFAGGKQTFAFRIKDASGGVGYQECTCYIAGVLPLESYDLWFGTASFAAYSYSSNNLTVGYREVGGKWNHIALTASGIENVYNATATDFVPSKSYEYALFENGTQVGLTLSVTTAAGNQIPEAGFEAWSTAADKAECPAADPYALFWDTGNHATASLTGSQLTVSSTDVRSGATGTKSAYMKSIKASVMGIGKFAAGNLFVGRFVRVDVMGGIVEFGRPFDFNARPKAIRFWMKNNQGTINEGSHTSGTDLAKIYCCLTDRNFTVNTNDESTLFTPAITTDGILASAYYDSTESHSEWTLIEIPFEYRDNLTTKPTILLLTFTCSGYGDYFTGSTDSFMYIDDVELVY